MGLHLLHIKRIRHNWTVDNDHASDHSKSNVLMFDENLKGKSIQKIDQFNTDDKTEIIVIIGPEGGFEEKERQLIFKNSKTFQNVSLGPQILKADTAVIAALSLTFHYFS